MIRERRYRRFYGNGEPVSPAPVILPELKPIVIQPITAPAPPPLQPLYLPSDPLDVATVSQKIAAELMAAQKAQETFFSRNKVPLIIGGSGILLFLLLKKRKRKTA